jgi:uncharacterized protein YndB with AHSA1/START domain
VSRWLGPVLQLHAREGGSFDVEFTHDLKHTISGRITTLDHERALELEWNFPGEPVSHVRFELRDEGDSVRLVIDHRGLDRAASTAYGEGWKTHLAELENVIREGATT